jgi:hypothetical protein
MALAVFASVAAAAHVTHRTHVDRFTSLNAAGDFCDFTWKAQTKVTTHSIIFGSPNSPSREIDHLRYQAVNTNVDTGLRIIEDDRYTVIFSRQNHRYKYVGAYWHLTDASGKRVLVSAGQFIVDFRKGAIIKRTPNIDPDFAGVICPALGGSSAIG